METFDSATSQTDQKQRSLLIRLGRWLGWTALALLALFLLVFTYDRIASAVEARRFPPPGQMVDVGTHRLHLTCMGAGSPTVLVETGSGSWSVDWRMAQAEIAQSTRVCVYERAGYGWSEAGPTPRTGEQMVAELHALVTNAEIERPFVLVAHSFGGLNARLYADRHPEDVAGLVLLDTRHEDFSAARPAPLVEAEQNALSTLSTALFLERTGLIRPLGPVLGVIPPVLPKDLRPVYRANFQQAKFLRGLADEVRMAPITETQAAKTGDLGDLPLIVVSHDPRHPIAPPGMPDDITRRAEELWQQTQREMTALSSQSEFIVTEGSGHNIYLERPDIVRAVVDQMLSLVEGE